MSVVSNWLCYQSFWVVLLLWSLLRAHFVCDFGDYTNLLGVYTNFGGNKHLFFCFFSFFFFPFKLNLPVLRLPGLSPTKERKKKYNSQWDRKFWQTWMQRAVSWWSPTSVQNPHWMPVNTQEKLPTTTELHPWAHSAIMILWDFTHYRVTAEL